MKISKRKFPVYYAHDSVDCGPTCIKMISQYYDRFFSNEYLSRISFLSRDGVSLQSLKEASETIGFTAVPVKISYEDIIKHAPFPCILHWNHDHFVVLYKISKNIFSAKKAKSTFTIADPADGLITIDEQTFKKYWLPGANKKGTALLLHPTDAFYDHPEKKDTANKIRISFKYLYPHKKILLQVAFTFLIGSLISLAFPLLMQILIDQGVNGKNISLVYLVLLSQVLLFVGDTVLGNIRSWLLMYVGTRISFMIISDFLNKLFRLPIRFFDSKKIGDFSQRMDDHHRIERFLTGSVLHSCFSILSIAVFTIIIAYYSVKVLLVYVFLNSLGISWVFLFKNKRKQLDARFFSNKRRTVDKFHEMITGMQEIKLYNNEKLNIAQWEELQLDHFKLNERSALLQQYQHSGFLIFSNLKNILISFISAGEVIHGNMTLGILLSISYIVGQTNGPITQLVDFVKLAQDAKLSMERLEEIHNESDEEKDPATNGLSLQKDIFLQNVSFQFEGKLSPFVLRDVSFTIPRGKTTALVGASGSGKTTLMKLLLRFYEPVTGTIKIGNSPLHSISPRLWRGQCGTVMQDGYLFNDTIANNIAMSDMIDDTRLNHAISVAHLEKFIEQLPLGVSTKIGSSGAGISGGQKQRILIARAVYKDPQHIFFDEATSSLDATSESVIMKNLDQFFHKKTVLIIAHRMSTVKNADQIIVLDNGKVEEIGTHETLIKQKQKYFELVKNQLELGT